MSGARAPEVNCEVGRAHGLTDGEYDKMISILGRTPSFTELGLFMSMWSEHCSYKSSRLFLKDLPTTGPCVVHGPGENAGVVDIGDGQVAVFKMESHNHPSPPAGGACPDRAPACRRAAGRAGGRGRRGGVKRPFEFHSAYPPDAKDLPVEFFLRPPGRHPWRVVSGLCRRRG